MRTRQERMRFGDFEIDLRSRELRKAGAAVHLQDQPFQILALLLEHHGEVVTRDELRARLWSAGTFVDFEHALNAAVKRLRVALGDTAENPRFIETLHRRGYRFIGAIDAGASTLAERMTMERRPRLVVLPFANLGSAEQGYFTDGLSEELITEIGRRCAGRIGVLARTSCWLYKDAARAAGDIGKALQVEYLVEGSVRREGDRVRITAKLIETSGETQLWADAYDRNLADCLAVQAEVSAHIAQALMRELFPSMSPEAPISAPGSPNPAAYQAFLRGRFYWNQSGGDVIGEAIRHYDRAIALDGQFGRAYSARARAGVSLCEYYLAEPVVVMEGVRRDALRALELDPADSEALVSLAEVHRMFSWDWSTAEATYQAALQANPNSEATHRYYALFLASRGRSEALRVVDRGRDLDPLCSVNITASASVRFFAGDYEAAIECCRAILEMNPGFGPARRRMASALAELGRYREAIDEYSLISPERLDPVSRAWMGQTLAIAGQHTAAQALAVSLENAADGRPAPPFHLAILYAGLDDRDRAFDALARACVSRDPSLDTLEVEPRFRSLRRDPRYGKLLDRLRLTSGLTTA